MPRTTEQNKILREQASKKIIDAAMQLFAKKGFHGTSMNDIAKKAGVSKGLAYNYFHSKKHLLWAILGQLTEMTNAIVVVLDKPGDPFDKLKMLINYTFDHIKESEEFWLLYMGLAFQPDVLGDSMKIFDDVFASFYRSLEKVFKQCGIKNAVAESRLYGALIDGILLAYFMNKEKYPLAKVRKQFLHKYSKEELQKQN